MKLTLLDKVPRYVLAALLAAMAATLPPGGHGALANGGGTEIFRARQGAYEIVVWVQPERPVVGAAHLTITPLNAETSVPVLEAEINIVANDPQGVPTYRVRALSAPLSLQYYDANITFDSSGDWTLSVSVEHSTLGRAMVDVPLHVDEQPLGPSLAGTIVWLAVISILAGGAAYVWSKQRRAAARP